MSGSPLGPLALLAVAVAVDAWVFLDAKRRQDSGDDVVASVGPVTLSEPAHWLLGCIVLWILVVPLYLVARRA
ncbi:MAG: hypothetical protein AB7O74_14720 [Candidatus Nanopelagicales bacterium]